MVDEGVVVSSAPRRGAPRRGIVELGTRLAFSRRVFGDGCEVGVWVEVPSGGFICERYLAYSREAPWAIVQPAVAPRELLPYRYAFVAADGTRAYARPSDYDADELVESYGEGFGLSIVGREIYDGVAFARTRRGLYVPEESLRFANGSSFRGIELGPTDRLDVAWVTRDGAVLRDPRARTVRRAGRRDLVRVARSLRAGLLELTTGETIAARDLQRPTFLGLPADVGEDDRWIDVDVATQTLVVYEGTRPLFATLVSTGRATPTHATPLGSFPIWVKLATSPMNDLERSDVEQNYAIDDVPWVQFFEGSNGLHAAFWHDDFGRRRSHGCVNLSPSDARTVFSLTGPALPPGWTAILPNESDRPTIVRVRDGARLSTDRGLSNNRGRRRAPAPPQLPH